MLFSFLPFGLKMLQGLNASGCKCSWVQMNAAWRRKPCPAIEGRRYAVVFVDKIPLFHKIFLRAAYHASSKSPYCRHIASIDCCLTSVGSRNISAHNPASRLERAMALPSAPGVWKQRSSHPWKTALGTFARANREAIAG